MMPGQLPVVLYNYILLRTQACITCFYIKAANRQTISLMVRKHTAAYAPLGVNNA